MTRTGRPARSAAGSRRPCRRRRSRCAGRPSARSPCGRRGRRRPRRRCRAGRRGSGRATLVDRVAAAHVPVLADPLLGGHGSGAVPSIADIRQVVVMFQVREMIPALRRGLPAGEAQLLQVEEERPGSARGVPSDGRDARAGRRPQISGRRSIQAVPVDLAAIRGLADAAGDFRSDDHRHCRGRLHVSRQRLGAKIRRLSASVPVAGGGRRIAKRKKKTKRARARALPQVSEGQVLRLEEIRPDQHFTEPPPRYNDATLVKELEEKGIGRPSTYASIISTIWSASTWSRSRAVSRRRCWANGSACCW